MLSNDNGFMNNMVAEQYSVETPLLLWQPLLTRQPPTVSMCYSLSVRRVVRLHRVIRLGQSS